MYIARCLSVEQRTPSGMAQGCMSPSRLTLTGHTWLLVYIGSEWSGTLERKLVRRPPTALDTITNADTPNPRTDDRCIGPPLLPHSSSELLHARHMADSGSRDAVPMLADSHQARLGQRLPPSQMGLERLHECREECGGGWGRSRRAIRASKHDRDLGERALATVPRRVVVLRRECGRVKDGPKHPQRGRGVAGGGRAWDEVPEAGGVDGCGGGREDEVDDGDGRGRVCE